MPGYFGEDRKLIASLSCSLVFAEGQEADPDYLLQLPMHLISDARLNAAVMPYAYAEVAYEASTADIDDFLDFYERTGWYQTETEGGVLRLTGYKKKPYRGHTSDITFELPFPLEFHFSQQYGTTYFVIGTERASTTS